MSYSLISEPECGNCKKFKKCIDLQIVGGAVMTIHTLTSSKGHLGGGSITLKCSNFEQKD